MLVALVFLFFFVATLMVVIEGILAYADGLFLLRQIHNRGYSIGLPCVFHGALWTDLIVINPLMAAILYLYSGAWSPRQVIVVGAIAFITTFGLHALYSKSKTPDPLAWKGKVTRAGYVHVLYMGMAFTVIGLLYFCTPLVDPLFLKVASSLLAFHVFVGTQMLLNIFQPLWWGKTLLSDWQSLVTLLSAWGLIFFRTYGLLR
jgi:hypothetical protein